MMRQSAKHTGYWALVARPDVYDVMRAIREQDTDTWTVGRQEGIREGDRVLLWKARGNEKHRGVVSLGEVLEEATVRLPMHPRYYDPHHQPIREPRIMVRYDKPAIQPIWYDGSPPLAELTCARATGGTVFIVQPGQWEAIEARVHGVK